MHKRILISNVLTDFAQFREYGETCSLLQALYGEVKHKNGIHFIIYL